MKQRPRIYYTQTQRAMMWERWKQGESLQQIAKLFNRTHSSVQRILAETGGIRPAERHRSRLALTLAEREEISRSLAAGHSIRSIARLLNRAPSTVSREINRNDGQNGYRASCADQAAWDRAHRPKNCKLIDKHWHVGWPASSNCSGHPSRLPAGLSTCIRATRTTRCHMKRFIAVSSFRLAEL